MINEPCLNPGQFGNHQQAPRSDFTAKTQFHPLLGNQHHVSTVVAGGGRFRPLSSPRLPDSQLVNHSPRMLNHNFYNEEVGFCMEKFREEESVFHNDSWRKFDAGEGVQASNLNLPNVSKMTPEIASSVMDLTTFHTENQEGAERSGTIEANQLINEVSQPLPEYVNLLNKLEDDSYDFCDINKSEVDKYCEWLMKSENRNGPESFISSDAENVPIEDTQYAST